MATPAQQLHRIELDLVPGRPGALQTVFAIGFRPFFLMATVFATLAVAVWTGFLATGTGAGFFGTWGIPGWHGHEMVFGYGSAVVVGFLLTASANWTGLETLRGWPLAGLCGLWLGARVLAWSGIDPVWPGAFDFMFMLAASIAFADPVLRADNRRNLIFVPFLAVLTLAGVISASGAAAGQPHWTRTGNLMGLWSIIGILLIVAGRVVPFFAERALGTRIPRAPRLDRYVLGGHVVWAAARLTGFDLGAAAVALVVGGALIMRIVQCFDRGVLQVPLLWILVAGQALLASAYLVDAAEIAGWFVPGASIHLFTIGGIGVFTIGMMVRVSLGHTGRALRAQPAHVVAFVAIVAAAVMRPAAVSVGGDAARWLMLGSGGAWLVAFASIAMSLAPLLLTPRVDGRLV